MEDQRAKFSTTLEEILTNRKPNSTILTPQDYTDLICELQRIENNGPRSSTTDYKKKSLYEVRSFSGFQRIMKRDTNTMMIHSGEYFDIINAAHAATQHGGRDVMLNDLRVKYANVPRIAIMAFLDLCENCQMKKKKPKKGLVVKPILSQYLNSRCQVDLIDWQTLPAGEYKFIFVYQDHLTKFIQLRPQVTKTAEETAYNVLDVMCIFGAPLILQSDNGREFSNNVIKKILSLWPECHLVHGKPRHSQSQGSVERANEDIQIKLRSWMRDNQTTNWVEGLRFVQIKKNRCLNSGIGRSPYTAMFGCELRVGLSDTVLPVEVVRGISTEEDLEEKLRALENEKSTDTAETEYSEMHNQIDCSTCVEQEPIPNFAEDAQTSERMPLARIVANEQAGGIRNSASQENRMDVVPHSSSKCCLDRHESDNESDGCVPAKQTCIACSMPCSAAHTCKECFQPCHVICAASQCNEDDEGFGSKITCPLCFHKENITKQRCGAKRKQAEQAAKMKMHSARRLDPATIGQNVEIRIPDLDRGKADHLNITAIILDENDGFFTLGTKVGTIDRLYVRNEFILCKEQFILATDVPKDKKLSLRQAVSQLSIGYGQGYLRCNCTTKCSTKRCKCKAMKILCSSKCHSSLSCSNK